MVKNIFELENFVENLLIEKFKIDTKIVIAFSAFEKIDFQINSLIKYKKLKNFNNIVKFISTEIEKLKIIQTCEDSPQGFINMTVSNEFFTNNLKNTIDAIKKNINRENKKVFLDYGGANIGKALHVGHIRTLNIGRSLKNIYNLGGYETYTDIHFGDWGMPIGLILAYVEKERLNLKDIKASDLEFIYPEAVKLSTVNKKFYKQASLISKKLNDGDKDLLVKWRKIYEVSTENISGLLNILGFKFDIYKGESDVIELIPGMVDDFKKRNLIEIDGGAYIATDNNNPPSIIVKSDGSYVYLTTDLATVLDREENYNCDEYVYIVDQRQKNHFEQLFRLIKHFSISNKVFTHIGFGTINNKDGKPLKTRDGGNYKLVDLFDDIKHILKKKNEESDNLDLLAKSVLTYSDLVTSRLANYKFDLDKFTNINGKSATYIQYSQVRAKKLLRDFNRAPKLQKIKEDEKLLVMDILKFNYYFELSIKNNEPHHLAEYLYGLCQKFNTFYKSKKIFSEHNSDIEISHLIYIVESFYNTLLVVFECLGIEPVESM